MRSLDELRDVFLTLTSQLRQAWAESDVDREAEYSTRIEEVLVETISHPDYDHA